MRSITCASLDTSAAATALDTRSDQTQRFARRVEKCSRDNLRASQERDQHGIQQTQFSAIWRDSAILLLYPTNEAVRDRASIRPFHQKF
jgi:hypothetical protein